MTPVSTKTHKCSQIRGPNLSDTESKCRLLFNWTVRGWPFLWLGKESATVPCINATLLSISSTLWGWEWVGLRCGAPGKQEGLKSPGWRWHFTLAVFEPGKPQQANRAKADMKIKQGNLLKSNKILRLETTLCIWVCGQCMCARNMVPLYLNVTTYLQPIRFIWQGNIGIVMPYIHWKFWSMHRPWFLPSQLLGCPLSPMYQLPNVPFQTQSLPSQHQSLWVKERNKERDWI